ncbi:family 43 glycosylhydrolase [Nocardioides sp. zg-1228]|uniref:family 43 glycosylhydrolase n=1 Tax=Nocardioides sp. zg-1228 TaxID=2763008 RepID=UPI00164245A1|nr:family 43 glycosylhydrolase [Nocardioides sp. zg-1228]MBC2932945.1 family 43 glycosylhydrolase [Nocardioides sp. zg-1228]QSF56852.1 family 43 glycosylhydrolase [Nocardioides sp. zg-1228]
MKPGRLTRVAAAFVAVAATTATATLASTAVIAQAAPVGTEVIVNGGAEETTIAPWQARGGGTVTVTRNTDDKATGTASLLAADRSSSVQGISQRVTVDPGSTYSVSAKIKYTDADPVPASMKFNLTADYGSSADGAQYVVLASSTIARGSWATFSGSFTIPADRAVGNFQVYFENDFGLTAYPASFGLDDVSITKTGEGATPVTRPDLLERNDNTEAGSFGAFAKLPGTTGVAARGNPLVTQNFGADPWAFEFDGRVYVYTTNDTQEWSDWLTKGESNNYGLINQINVWSSADMVNWTNHGGINAAGPAGLSGTSAGRPGNSWAPAVVAKDTDGDGDEEVFLYFANSAGGIWVLKGDSPVGPFTAPRQTALVSFDTPGVRNNSNPDAADVWWLFDPAVLVDDDGSGYLYFGGGVPEANGQQVNPDSPGTARAIKLGDDMVSLADDDGDGAVDPAVLVDAPAVFEDSGIHKVGDTYYYSYCTNFTNNRVINGRSLGRGNIHYMKSDSPLGPWTEDTYVGPVFQNQSAFFGVGGNNHHAIFSFDDQWYLTYHAETLDQALQSPSGTKGFRNAHIDRISIAADGTITPATGTRTGPGQLADLDPYAGPVSAETIAWQAGTRQGFDGDGSFGTTVPTSILTSIDNGDWTSISNADFGARGAQSLVAKVRGRSGGTITVSTSPDRSATAAVLGSVEVPAGDGSTWSDVTVPITAGALNGVSDVYFSYAGAAGTKLFDVASWTFTAVSATTPPTTPPTVTPPTVTPPVVVPPVATPPAVTRVVVRLPRSARGKAVRVGTKLALKVTLDNVPVGTVFKVRDGKKLVREVTWTGAPMRVTVKVKRTGTHRYSVVVPSSSAITGGSDSVKVKARARR